MDAYLPPQFDQRHTDGITLGGWYKETECTNAWVFDTDTVTADTTLYAKWTQMAQVGCYVYDDATSGMVAGATVKFITADET